jgi:hypothetical protein
MSTNISAYSSINSGDGNNWNDDLFTFDPVSANYSDLAVQKIGNQVKGKGSRPKPLLYSQLDSAFSFLDFEWTGFEYSKFMPFEPPHEDPSALILTTLKNNQVEENGSSSNPKKRLYSELNSQLASLDPKELNNSKRIKCESTNSNTIDAYSVSIDSDDDSSSYSSDISYYDVSMCIWNLAAIENSIPNLSDDENSYSTSEMVNPPDKVYESTYFDKLKGAQLKYKSIGAPLKFLNGKLIHHSIPDDATEKLRENLKTAKKIIRFVRDAVPFSSNYLQRARIFSSSLYDGSAAILTIQKISRTLKILRKKTSRRNTLEQIVSRIAFFKVGNCSELCKTGLLLSHAKNQQPQNCTEMFDGGFDEVQKQAPVEIFHIAKPRGDHTFLVVDRDQRFPPSHYWLWGPDAVVCDVWSGAHYPAFEVRHHLWDYVSVVHINQMPHTVVRHFNPDKQRLTIPKPYSTIK